MSTELPIQKDISCPPRLDSAAANRQIRNILRAQPWIECDLITVETEGNRAILRGVVYSTAERDQVEAAARKLGGVTAVDNRITLIREQQAKPG